MRIRDRIKELRRVKASELIPNPKNWRTHPVEQQDAMKGVLSELGYADALIAREVDEGLMLVDGHLRAETTPDSEVPVLVLDINEDEADLMLLTLDPLAAMAGRDEERLDALLEGIEIDNEAVTQLLNNLAVTIPDIPEPEINTYTDVIETPIYEPTGEQPAVEELLDRSKAEELIAQIVEAGLDTDIESFLIDAAERHVEFSFEKIANYYAHASEDVQKLIEKSALVIIDYDQAISDGFVRLREDIDTAFHEDYPDA